MSRPPTPAAAVRPRRREQDVQIEILRALRAHSIACWKVGTGTFRSTYKGKERYVQMGHKGMADIIGIVSEIPGHATGRFLAIEVKQPGEGPTLEQRAFLESVNASGGIGFVAHSVDEVAEALGWTIALPPAAPERGPGA